jgi:G3E family GTPase
MKKMPVSVLTGFLGAGKTTLLNRILSDPDGGRYAVVINEFADVGIDADLVISSKEEIIQLNNGCLCCTIRGDLLLTITSLLERQKDLDGILIETSGIANPAAIAQTFFLDEVTRLGEVRLDAIITVVDAKHYPDETEQNTEQMNQIALADVVLLNKIDLVTPPIADILETRIRQINPSVSIHRSIRCEVPISELLDRSAYSLAAIGMRDLVPRSTLRDSAHAVHQLSSVSIRSLRPVDPDDFMQWIQDLLRDRGTDLLRSKGILAFADEPRQFVFHGVLATFDGDLRRHWRPAECRESRIVFIGRNLDKVELRRGFESCLL